MVLAFGQRAVVFLDLKRSKIAKSVLQHRPGVKLVRYPGAAGLVFKLAETIALDLICANTRVRADGTRN